MVAKSHPSRYIINQYHLALCLSIVTIHCSAGDFETFSSSLYHILVICFVSSCVCGATVDEHVKRIKVYTLVNIAAHSSNIHEFVNLC